MSRLLIIFVSFWFIVGTTHGFCFHQYGGEGEYHKKCDSTVGMYVVEVVVNVYFIKNYIN